MKKLHYTLLILLAIYSFQANSQDYLLDEVTREQLSAPPYSEWFQAGYDNYIPNAEILNILRNDLASASVELYFATWCGDSRREVPKFLKLMDELGIEKSQIKLYALDYEDGVYKQSPSKFEAGKSIYRVPTFRIMNNQKELGRIVEYPVVSFEMDLRRIVNGEDYLPNYKSFPFINDWLEAGLLTDKTVNITGLANSIRPMVYHWGEIYTAAKVLDDQGKSLEALALYRINAYLFRESPSSQVMLARAYGEAGEYDKALDLYRDAWVLEPGDDDIYNELIALVEKKAGLKLASMPDK
ncbi:MAG: hypothetical protein RJQ09_01295 [Cyclobacteriaceae bacterium]